MIHATLILASAILQVPDPGGFEQPGPPPGQQPAGVQNLSRLVAVVNDQVLTSLKVDRLAFSIAMQQKQAGQNLTQQDMYAIRQQAFGGLVIDMLYREGFRMEGIDASILDRIVADQLDQRIKQAGSLAAFNRALGSEGKSLEEFTQELRGLYTSVLFMQMEAGMMPTPSGGKKASVWVRPDEVRDFYRENIDDYRREFRVAARMILIRGEGGDTARLQLTNLRSQIRSGGISFPDAARENSDYRASVGGSLGWVNPESSNLQKPILEFLTSAAPGEMSEPIQVTGGWVIALAEEVRPAGLVPFQDVQLEITAELIGQHRVTLQREVINRLRSRCYLWGDEVDVVLDYLTAEPDEEEEAF